MDSQKRGLPLITIIICLLCVLVFAEQYGSNNRYLNAANEFCSEPVDSNTQVILDRIADAYPGAQCNWAFETIRESADRAMAIELLVETLEPLHLFAALDDDRRYMASRIEERARRYEIYVPRALTQDLAYDPNEPRLRQMITSTFSHGDLMHLLGNLLFFFVFGASVELIIGYLAYALFIGAVTIGTSFGYSYAMMGVEEALPTIGLSGVVMATLAALGVMMPHARIRCFFWFIWIFRVFLVPVYLLAIWYVGWDLVELNRMTATTYVDYASHVTGAIMGGLLGAAYLVYGKTTISRAAMEYG